MRVGIFGNLSMEKDAKPGAGIRDSRNEHDLVQDLRNGDEAAFTALVTRYHQGMVRVATAFVPDRAVAEEVAQETWLSVLEGIKRFEERSSLKTWLFRILVNRARTRGKQEGRMINLSATGPEKEPGPISSRFTPEGMWKLPPAVWPDPTPEEQALSAELREVIRASVDGLPPGQRAVVTMRDVEGLSSREVCNILDIGESNQRVLLHRGRTRVRGALERYLGNPPGGKGREAR